MEPKEGYVLREWRRYGHMIDNVVLIVTGTLHERDVQELLEKCHPLGMFDRLVLVDTPLAPYFSECITSEVLVWRLFQVPLCCVLRIYEAKGAGDQEPNVDFRVCCSEPEVQSS
ncbi:hypothetical protein RIF29_42073 [Crotalaria pallida]|uniref:Uncharacterized protein n=1 Tax=Crotalaria pallida TaxID=3830 RepID=A0AAN9E7I1_CROPI